LRVNGHDLLVLDIGGFAGVEEKFVVCVAHTDIISDIHTRASNNDLSQG
jgi:hypothetical protein